MRQLISRALFLSLFFSTIALVANAQGELAVVSTVPSGPAATSGPETPAISRTEVEEMRRELGEHRRLLQEQRAEIDRLRAELSAHTASANDLRAEVRATPMRPASTERSVSVSEAPPANTPQTDRPLVEDRLKRVEERMSQLGNIRFAGDIRLRFESIRGLLDTLPNANNPLVTGNNLPAQNHAQIRARLQLRGTLSDEFDWGLRLATGSSGDSISTNQTLTDFYNRKQFALDQAFITYKPRQAPGLLLQGGKFEPPWIFTEMTIDNDLMVEGFNESYSRAFKTSKLKELTFVAWQLPLFERNPSLTLASAEETRRSGRDLALYGAQVRTLIELSKGVTLRLSVSDLYFSGTQFITPVKLFGDEIQFPATITLPATMTSPASTVTGQVRISRALLVAGTNLGLSTATNNAINSDGRLSSGYNLVDLIASLNLTHSRRFPMFFLFNFVTNTQARDVITTTPGRPSIIQPNNERNGYWLQYQIGGTRVRGDVALNYTFMRIQKDAVLTPFNFSDVTQQSDVRAHRFAFAYALDPRVVLSATGIITSRVNGLAGPFGVNPPDSLNRSSVRFQFDTIFRF